MRKAAVSMTIEIEWNGQAEHTMRRKKPLYVFVAGPLGSSGLAWRNVRKAVFTANTIVQLGHTPFIPHLYMFADMMMPQDESYWENLDIEWLEACDCVVRMDGESTGADNEVSFAAQRGMPVFYGIDTFGEWCEDYSEQTKELFAQATAGPSGDNGAQRLVPRPDPPVVNRGGKDAPQEEWTEFVNGEQHPPVQIAASIVENSRFSQLGREIGLITTILTDVKWIQVPTKALREDGQPGKVRYYIEGASDSVQVSEKNLVLALRLAARQARADVDAMKSRGSRERAIEHDLLRRKSTP